MFTRQTCSALAVGALLFLAKAGCPEQASAQDPPSTGLDEYNLFQEELPGVPPLEMPILQVVAREAGVAPSEVLDMRLSGRRWHSVLEHYGLSPAIFRVPLDAQHLGEPYRRIYRYSEPEWDEIYLSDQDYIDLANLKQDFDRYQEPFLDLLRQRAESPSPPESEERSERRRRDRAKQRERWLAEQRRAENRAESQRAERRLAENRAESQRAEQRLAENRAEAQRAEQRLAENRAEEERARRRRAEQCAEEERDRQRRAQLQP